MFAGSTAERSYRLLRLSGSWGNEQKEVGGRAFISLHLKETFVYP
jgi:hypothetical protein